MIFNVKIYNIKALAEFEATKGRIIVLEALPSVRAAFAKAREEVKAEQAKKASEAKQASLASTSMDIEEPQGEQASMDVEEQKPKNKR